MLSESEKGAARIAIIADRSASLTPNRGMRSNHNAGNAFSLIHGYGELCIKTFDNPPEE
jgi:hypothetical protein